MEKAVLDTLRAHDLRRLYYPAQLLQVARQPSLRAFDRRLAELPFGIKGLAVLASEQDYGRDERDGSSRGDE